MKNTLDLIDKPRVPMYNYGAAGAFRYPKRIDQDVNVRDED